VASFAKVEPLFGPLDAASAIDTPTGASVATEIMVVMKNADTLERSRDGLRK
jgi:hypothetical protein